MKRFDDRWCACQADGDPMGPWHPYGDTDWCPAAGPVDPFEVPSRPSEADFDALPRVPRGLLF